MPEQCACPSIDAIRCTQLRAHLSDADMEAMDPEDRECDCICHGGSRLYCEDYDDD